MPVVPRMTFRQHVQKWKDCEACGLCANRKNVVFARGAIPCDVLLIGEAPGDSEDVLGYPFMGPAGHLLNNIVLKALAAARRTYQDTRIGFTNLVMCIPKREGEKQEPTREEIEACSERLMEFLAIAKPKLLVMVGELAKKYGPTTESGQVVTIIHPAAILRADESVRGLAIQRCVVTLADALENL